MSHDDARRRSARCAAALGTLSAALVIAACATPSNAKETIMTPRELAETYFAMWNSADLGLAERAIAADVVGHVNAATLHGRETFAARVAALRGAYAEPRFTVEDVITEGDRAVVRWTFRAKNTGPIFGQPATHKDVVVSGMNAFRVARGKIVEIWVNADDLGELEQLGLVKPPA